MSVDQSHRRGDAFRPRRSDRAEQVLWWAAAVLTLAGILFSVAAGMAVHADGVSRSARESATRTPVDAVLLEETVPAGSARSGLRTTTRVPVRWIGPDRVEHTATALVPGRHQAGATMRIWVDRDDAVVTEPFTRTEAIASAVLAVALLLTGVVVLLAAMRLATGRYLDVLRRAEWAREWSEVEPRWSGRVGGTPGRTGGET
jgi:hypothetical protein